ncbi:MAG TPA: HEPN domain-containing protein [Blastocatellia bacterium]|nr:HEPN domain-containing protein [Blastocatellia bacterium]
MDKERIAAIENYLLRARDAANAGADNLSPFVKDRSHYDEILKNLDYNAYLQRGDMHYFVARILLLNWVAEYGYFCSQQCIENYLKGYLRGKGVIPPQEHNLDRLLEAAKKLTVDMGSFLQSDFIKVIVDKFNPFYELARYPAQITKPKDGKYVMFASLDVETIDYFIYRMRLIMKPPLGGWDILSDHGHKDLNMCREYRPEFYQFFLRDNMNFPY